jgi:RNA polymerase sigma factor (sigma-70 family)
MNMPSLQRELSIDEFIDGDEGARMGVFLADPKAVNQEERVHALEVMRLVRQAVVGLTARESHIIRHRFGLLGGDEQTFDEIGKALRLSRERVRQLEGQARDKLRAKLSCLRSHADAGTTREE